MFSPVAHSAPRATSTIATPRSLSLAGRTVRHYSQNPGQKIDKPLTYYKSAIVLGSFLGGVAGARNDLKTYSSCRDKDFVGYLASGGIGFITGVLLTGAAIAAFPITLGVGGVYLLSKDKQ